MKTTKYTFLKNDNTKTFPIINTTPKSTDYSAILDDLIAAHIKDTNPYLKSATPNTSSTIYLTGGSSLLKDDTIAFIKAANFLANYKKNLKKIKLEEGKTYKLSDGTPIIFFDDEIQIGFDIFNYDDFKSMTFLNGLCDKTKKTIINIFGAKNITINL